MGGLDKCLEAFERLKINEPFNSKYKDLPRERLTPAIVSKEAGFDAGYLKNSRYSHKALIILINDFRSYGADANVLKIPNVKNNELILALKQENILLKSKVNQLERVNLYFTELISKLKPDALIEICLQSEQDDVFFR